MRHRAQSIVGGRSRGDRIAGGGPRGMEILLKKARVDPAFLELLIEDPLGAAKSIELDLGDTEARILTHTPGPLLRAMVGRTFVAKQHIGTFRTARTAAALVLALSSTLVAPAFASAGVESYPAFDLEQQDLARQRMAAVQAALEEFRTEHGRYPQTSEWLSLAAPLSLYLSPADTYDPWKRRLHYQGVKEQGVVAGYKLESLGLDEQSIRDNIPCPMDTDRHRFSGVAPLRILFPQEGDAITIGSDQEPGKVIVVLRAEHENSRVIVDWYLDGAKVRATIQAHTLEVTPGLGNHILVVVDENESYASVRFSVSQDQ